MNMRPNIRRRQLTVAIGSAMTPLVAPLFLGSCGGGDDRGSSSASPPTTASAPTSSSSPAATPTSTAPTDDVTYTFDLDDPRIVHFVAPNGGPEATYYGTKDTNGTPTSITSFVYLRPSSARDSFSIECDESNLELLFANSDRFDLSAAGAQYLFKLMIAASGKTVAGIYDPLTQTVNSLDPSSFVAKRQELIRVAADAMKRASSSTKTAALCLASVIHEQTGTPSQEIVASVEDHCGIVTTGTGTAVIKPATHYEIGTIGSLIIAKPPYHVKLTFDTVHQGFWGTAPLDQLNTDMQVGFKEVAQNIVDDVKKDLKDKSLIAVGTAVVGLILGAPIALEALLDATPFAIAFEIGKMLKKHKDNTDENTAAWEITQDIIAAHKSSSPYFPINIQATYNGDGGEITGQTVIENPGTEPANIELLLPSTTGPCSTGSVAGKWVGSVTQPGGPFGDYDDYAMELTVVGSVVTGTSYIGNPGGYFASMTLKGSVAGDKFTFSEMTITSAVTPPNGFWCLKSATLEIVHYGNQQSMSGPWTAPSCLPGDINLYKES